MRSPPLEAEDIVHRGEVIEVNEKHAGPPPAALSPTGLRPTGDGVIKPPEELRPVGDPR
jgi:hypothetical protein